MHSTSLPHSDQVNWTKFWGKYLKIKFIYPWIINYLCDSINSIWLNMCPNCFKCHHAYMCDIHKKLIDDKETSVFSNSIRLIVVFQTRSPYCHELYDLSCPCLLITQSTYLSPFCLSKYRLICDMIIMIEWIFFHFKSTNMYVWYRLQWAQACNKT